VYLQLIVGTAVAPRCDIGLFSFVEHETRIDLRILTMQETTYVVVASATPRDLIFVGYTSLLLKERCCIDEETVGKHESGRNPQFGFMFQV
jgi:hypothetical protein